MPLLRVSYSCWRVCAINTYPLFYVRLCAGWVRTVRYSPNGLLIACGMGGDTEASFPCQGGSKRHSPREEDGTIKIVSGESRSWQIDRKARLDNTASDRIRNLESRFLHHVSATAPPPPPPNREIPRGSVFGCMFI